MKALLLNFTVKCPVTDQVVSLDEDDIYMSPSLIEAECKLLCDCLCGKEHELFSVEL